MGHRPVLAACGEQWLAGPMRTLGSTLSMTGLWTRTPLRSREGRGAGPVASPAGGGGHLPTAQAPNRDLGGRCLGAGQSPSLFDVWTLGLCLLLSYLSHPGAAALGAWVPIGLLGWPDPAGNTRGQGSSLGQCCPLSSALAVSGHCLTQSLEPYLAPPSCTRHPTPRPSSL